MDAQSRNKALFRAKLIALKKEKQRIESPLVRYNESDQPVCRVCEVVLKSNSHWDAHQASRKHHEAISALKANAAGLSRSTNKSNESHYELPRPRPEPPKELPQQTAPQPSTESPKIKASSGLPPDFFDNDDTKRPKPGGLAHAQAGDSIRAEDDATGVRLDNVSMPSSSQSLGQISKVSKQNVPLEGKRGKGALPEGFFDNKDADLRARGVNPVKIDVRDEYKEFEKLIQEDLQEVDDRLEEEEIDAAEMIEEAESVEQKTYRERVEVLQKKKIELKAARSAKRRRHPEKVSEEASPDESSSDEDTVENFAVDWRAQHL
ncbi:zinc finger protein 830 [Punica granatum]|uniref:C2H2-type domain-containing protein n=2 Tax=Punica granatum TaxID=22663 RepID=A0A218VWJ6_PUNGR|nr:zinc finger protein 830 [Punica granatum]XP_031396203.1 zinc finger protein 830 [Punica granatum]XP_031396204.1 zinc finger protein 830 [Punica granatum]OWM64371.1 hypothetical protein CDL15_Pgr020337 [Punica granatum]PKI54417.1 hypothetical protein CRG98_025204 [Punica granatum]